MDSNNEADVSITKQRIREQIWRLMEEKAAERLKALPIFADARVVKVNPDAPQKPVREHVLRQGKTLLVPTPRLRNGFLLIDPSERRSIDVSHAATIRGASRYGRPVGLSDLPKVDLVIAGSVAVSTSGARIGKGGGYSEIEYGILRELHLVDDRTPVATTVHELQIVDYVPMERHDLIMDNIVTPIRVIETKREGRPPLGILWDEVTNKTLERIPILKDLAKLSATCPNAATVSKRLVADQTPSWAAGYNSVLPTPANRPGLFLDRSGSLHCSSLRC